MKTDIVFIAAVLSCLATPLSLADIWGPIEQTEFSSENGKHLLKISPHAYGPLRPGHCRATLYAVEGARRTEVWSRFLINDHAPVDVFVSDSGEYVLTMDEWGHVGKLPVVMYGERGQLIRVHSTDSLGLSDDMETTVSSYWWNLDAISFFGPEEEVFFIRLHCGKWIVLELRTGNVLQKEKTFFRDELRKQHEQKWKTLEEYREKALAEHAIQILSSADAHDRKTGALVCGQEKLTRAIPKLRRLLADRAWFTLSSGTESTIVLYARQAAKGALEAMGQRVGKVVTTLPVQGHLRFDPATSRYVVDFDEPNADESVDSDAAADVEKPRR